jgi:hypothetical protein
VIGSSPGRERETVITLGVERDIGRTSDRRRCGLEWSEEVGIPFAGGDRAIGTGRCLG